MGSKLGAETLAEMRTRYAALDAPGQPEAERQARRDVLRLLDHIATLEAENARLLDYKEEAMAWGRALNEGGSDE